MDRSDIESIVSAERKFFDSGVTLDIKFRAKILTTLYNYIREHEEEIENALLSDLGKCAHESFMCEVGMVLSEISYMKKHLRGLAKRKKVKTPIAQFPSVSYELPSPYGCVLIMSPWNYPLLLTLGPLVDAIAAGNCAVVKPSAYSPATSELIAKMIGECFPPELVYTVLGGREENRALLQTKFDMIFFTGSQSVGREVLRHAAENLTPAVLELGGKSPCIVDESAKIELAARRIVFGKFLNCGETCVAPDYILCHTSVKEQLSAAICREITRQYGERPLESSDWGRIVSKKHFDRLTSLIDRDKVIHGGRSDAEALKIEPTVMDGVSFSDAVMGEEIFGPILPILTYESTEELIELLGKREKPLALYVFSENGKNIKALTTRLSFGGGCVNDVIIHLATSEMGFGGVGESGMGSYHGARGFDAFSHRKSIVDKSTRIDLPMRYRPYGSRLYRWLIRRFLK